MTEQTPDQAPPPPEGSATPTPPEGAEGTGDTASATPARYVPPVPKGNPGSGRYCVYDTQLLRYVGDVRDDKPSAKEARELAPGGYRILEV